MRQRTGGGEATRRRILATAAALFAKRGFYGTSTREIAEAVGIRQPSLFHHFGSKQDLIAELLNRDLEPALARIRRHRAAGAVAAVRLYAYLCEDVAALLAFPFDSRGLYNDEVLSEAALAPQLAMRHALHDETRGLIEEGIAAGEFRQIDPGFAQQIISGTLLDTIAVAGAGLVGDAAARPAAVADFVLLGLLATPGDLGRVRAAARTLAVV